MNRKSYILTKLTEEAAEVAQAACKHQLHDDRTTQGALEQEIGDLLAFAVKAAQRGIINIDRVYKHKDARIAREERKGKA